MFWCLKYDVLFAPFVLFSLLLATRVDTCSVVIFFFHLLVCQSQAFPKN